MQKIVIESKRLISYKIIEITKTYSAVFSGATAAMIPTLPLAADSASLSMINIKLINSLAEIYSIENDNSLEFISTIITKNSGTFISKSLFSMIPFIGTAINSVSTSHLTNITGWAALYSIEKYGYLKVLSSGDFKKVSKFEKDIELWVKNIFSNCNADDVKILNKLINDYLFNKETNRKDKLDEVIGIINKIIPNK